MRLWRQRRRSLAADGTSVRGGRLLLRQLGIELPFALRVERLKVSGLHEGVGVAGNLPGALGLEIEKVGVGREEDIGVNGLCRPQSFAI